MDLQVLISCSLCAANCSVVSSSSFWEFASGEFGNSFKLLFQSYSLRLISAEVKKDVTHGSAGCENQLVVKPVVVNYCRWPFNLSLNRDTVGLFQRLMMSLKWYWWDNTRHFLDASFDFLIERLWRINAILLWYRDTPFKHYCQWKHKLLHSNSLNGFFSAVFLPSPHVAFAALRLKWPQ